MCFCAWRVPAYRCHGDLTRSITEDGWPGMELGLVSRALGKAGFFLSHQIPFPDLGTDFCLSCLTKKLERLMTTDLCWLFGVYKALLQTLKVCNSDSDWITGSSLIQQWAEGRQGRAGQPAGEGESWFEWLDIHTAELQLVLCLFPALLSEASTQPFEISKGFDMRVRSWLKSKEEEINFRKSLKNLG